MNNPAARLLEILRLGDKQKQDGRAAAAWAEILETGAEDKALLLKRVGYVMALPLEIKSEIEQCPDIDQAIYLRWLPTAERAFGHLNFEMQWKQFLQHFQKDVRYGIEICAEVLSRIRPQTELNESFLNSAREDAARGLKELIDDQELPTDLKEKLIQHLAAVISAIDEYNLRGSGPIEAEVERVIGAVVRDQRIWEVAQSTKSGSRFWEVMGKVSLALGVIAGAIQIGENVVNVLPAPNPPQIEQAHDEGGSDGPET